MSNKFLLLCGGAIAVALGAALLPSAAPAPPPTAAERQAAEQLKQRTARPEIGDSVMVNYPASTILCGTAADSFSVWLTGEMAFRQTYRLENSIWKATSARSNGRKSAMSTAYSCQWAPRDVRFTVVERGISDSEQDNFRVAQYCLRPEDKTKCWFLHEDARSNSVFTGLRPKP